MNENTYLYSRTYILFFAVISSEDCSPAVDVDGNVNECGWMDISHHALKLRSKARKNE